MTVTTTLNKIIYPGNGSTTVFPFTFSVPANGAADIQVFFTSVIGVVTQLVQGPGASQYQLSLNPASGTNPTPVGGTVTYNPGGSPIPSGSFLTIVRVLPLSQNTSLATQTTLIQAVLEQGLDYSMMVSQQVLEIQNRALVVNLSDPTPNPLPAVASRANLFLAFDSSGNPIAAAPSGANAPVSSVMQPVVNAATLALARTNLGLGACAVENIGPGLQDDGAGNLRLTALAEVDAISQTITSAHHNHHHYASVAINYTFGQANTFFDGFTFWVTAQTAATTLVINAADRFSGMSLGQSMTIPQGATVKINTDGGNPGTWFTTLMEQKGVNAASNLTLVASVSAGALTIAVKDANGLDPSTNSPAYFTASAGGSSQQRVITTPLSITVPSGATLGTVNGQASRIWVGVFDGASGPVLGVYNALVASLSSPSILCWDETSATSATAISAGSTSPQTWYAATSQTNKAFRILGYVESTQPTAGTWSATTTPKLFGPGQKKPGDMVQKVVSQNNGVTAITSATFVVASGKTVAITPQSAANLIEVRSQGNASASAGVLAQAIISRGTVNNTGLINPAFGWNLPSASSGIGTMIDSYDLPNTTSQVTYATQIASNGVTTVNFGTTNQPVTQMEAMEIFA